MLLQGLNFVSVVATALMLWKGVSIVTNTESPIVVVLSGSMEPAFQRGDLLLLSLPPKSALRNGDITVYNVGGDIPIVHRVIEVHDEWVSLPENEGFMAQMFEARRLPQYNNTASTALVKSTEGVQDQWLSEVGFTRTFDVR